MTTAGRSQIAALIASTYSIETLLETASTTLQRIRAERENIAPALIAPVSRPSAPDWNRAECETAQMAERPLLPGSKLAQLSGLNLSRIIH